MIPSFPRARLAAFAVLAATALAVTAAEAQGTAEQQEACAPDAVRYCQATIPDIPKTTACMKANFARLSPRCKTAFNDVTGGKPSSPRRHERAAAAAAPPPQAAPEAAAPAPTVVTQNGFGLLPSIHGYEEQIRAYCRSGLIDPFTCRNTLATLQRME